MMGGSLNNYVFILGAGFSKAINPEYPTLKELSDAIEKRYKTFANNNNANFNKAKSCIAQHYFSIPNSIRNNFENLLTYLHSNFPWKTSVEQNLDKALYHDILKQLLEEFEMLPQQSNSKFLALGKFMHFKEATCLTFNYDLLLEDLLKRTTNENNLIFSDDSFLDFAYKNYYKVHLENFNIGNYFDINNTSNVSVLKLHGSVNWIYKSNSTPDKILFNATTKNYSVPEGYSPYIVPPVNDKTCFYNNAYLNQLWYKAKETLVMADNIYIIGYSFPKTDLSSEFLMKFALQSDWFNDKMKRNIYYINLKENNNLKALCNNNNIKLEQITCKNCPHYKRAGISSYCKNCQDTPLDKFIRRVINKKLKEDKADEI